MAEKIEFLLTHKEKARQLGANGRSFLQEHYNFEEYMKKMILKFDEMLIPNL